ncbi:polyketide synthase [Saccharothrix sp. Mg75]|uniref:beta-ketoacyl [acyl carrier protein] synthase domain-containing protein n=1 Tax=Saccharothrix sp. Mg75 TaxID=3445357 RepID=UPI003EEE035B
MTGDTGDDVAVIGMSCELPGASGPEELWRLLLDARDTVGPARPGTAMHSAGHVDPARWTTDFDPRAFDLDAGEAERMDPQQRLLLTAVRAALADAVPDPAGVAGSRTAVYAGQSGADHWDGLRGRDDLDLRDFAGAYHRGLTAGRLSHVFDLRGPSVTVDAAQASSLVALHLAVRALRHGEADLAIAAGVNLLLGPQPGALLDRAGALSPGGRCRFGDADADGFVRADGAAAVVLKPLAAALADGDRVRAVVKGSAVGNDGRAKPSLLHPSAEGQAQAMRWAYADAGVDPAVVTYVEAHGTGTRIDRAELSALTAVLGTARRAGRPCLVGSLKSNIGHAEAAAGLAGLVKAVLCLEHGAVPASLHHRRRHPDVDWDLVPLVVPTRTVELPEVGGRATVAVNGQSASSTNVHVVLTGAPARR